VLHVSPTGQSPFVVQPFGPLSPASAPGPPSVMSYPKRSDRPQAADIDSVSIAAKKKIGEEED